MIEIYECKYIILWKFNFIKSQTAHNLKMDQCMFLPVVSCLNISFDYIRHNKYNRNTEVVFEMLFSLCKIPFASLDMGVKCEPDVFLSSAGIGHIPSSLSAWEWRVTLGGRDRVGSARLCRSLHLCKATLYSGGFTWAGRKAPPSCTCASPRLRPWYPGGVGGGALNLSSLQGDVTQYTGRKQVERCRKWRDEGEGAQKETIHTQTHTDTKQTSIKEMGYVNQRNWHSMHRSRHKQICTLNAISPRLLHTNRAQNTAFCSKILSIYLW